jgi:hemerythrin superfamily protein
MKKRKIIHVDVEDFKTFKKIHFANELKNDEKKNNFLLQSFFQFKNTCEENNILKNNIQCLKEKLIQENEIIVEFISFVHNRFFIWKKYY